MIVNFRFKYLKEFPIYLEGKLLMAKCYDMNAGVKTIISLSYDNGINYQFSQKYDNDFIFTSYMKASQIKRLLSTSIVALDFKNKVSYKLWK